MVEPNQLLSVLCEADVAFVIVGGMAAVAQGSSIPTVDLDICYQRSVDNLERLTRALRPLNPGLRGAPVCLPFVLDVRTLKAGLNFTLITVGGDLDLLGEVAGLGFYEAVKTYAEEIELYGHRLWILTLEGLIRSKQASGRPKDLRALPELKALQALKESQQEQE